MFIILNYMSVGKVLVVLSDWDALIMNLKSLIHLNVLYILKNTKDIMPDI